MSILGSWAPDFVDHALDSAGKAAGSAVGIVTDAAGTIGDGLKYIPVIGPLYSALWTHYTSPLTVLNGIVQGNPVDKVALDTWHREVKVAKDVAPYAQTAIALVPGIGPVASGSISAGIALANGQTIDEALVEGVKGAIPGGALMKVAFDVGKSALEGKDVKEIAVSQLAPLVNAVGVPVPSAAQKALAAGLRVAQGAMRGEPAETMLVSEAIANLPDERRIAASVARNAGNYAQLADVLLQNGQRLIPNLSDADRKRLEDAFKVGLAIGTAKHYQAAYREEAASQTPFLTQAGQAASAADAALKAARDLIAFQNSAIVKNLSKERAIMITPIARTIAATTKRAAIVAPQPDAFPWGDTPWQEMQGFAGEDENSAEVGRGFDIGAGLMTHHGMTRAQFESVRATLSPLGKKGFDAAVAFYIGRVTQRAPKSFSDKEQAAYLMVKGLQGKYPQGLKESLVKDIVSDAQARTGAALAVNEFAMHRKGLLAHLLGW